MARSKVRIAWTIKALIVAVAGFSTFVVPSGQTRPRHAQSRIRVFAEPERSAAWDESVTVVVEGIEDSTSDEAFEWLQAGFAWTQKSRRFWRKQRSEEEPSPEAVQSTVAWLKEKGLARKAWVKRFPEVLGLAVEELEDGRKTAPSYLKSEESYNKAIKSNPQLLGKNYDCLQDHESCQGRCSRCWNT
ncbi:60S ribosomal protein L23-B [Durusdinium trenchii]|uniref:60S ribosomal protein L23-B n=1 Tax=Durusdinium trenchii TaxID=1381693 RepID=A0ABP0MNX5_9DINO